MTVEEGLLKTLPIGRGVATLQGDVEPALEFLSMLRDETSRLPERNAFEQVAISWWGAQSLFTIWFGFLEQQRPVLLKFSTMNHKIEEIDENTLESSGAFGRRYRSQFYSATGELNRKGVPARWYLVLVGALLQHYILHDVAQNYDVGGVVFGAAISAQGFEWMPDTTLIVYPFRPGNVEAALNEADIYQSFFLGGLHAVLKRARTFSPKVDARAHRNRLLWSGRGEEWGVQHGDEVHRRYLTLESDYYVFFCKGAGRVLVQERFPGLIRTDGQHTTLNPPQSLVERMFDFPPPDISERHVRVYVNGPSLNLSQ